ARLQRPDSGRSRSEGHRPQSGGKGLLDHALPVGVADPGRNHDRPAHIASRSAYYDLLTERIRIPGIVGIARDRDDPKLRSAGSVTTTTCTACWRWTRFKTSCDTPLMPPARHSDF